MKFSYTKNPESDFYKESKSKKNLAVRREGGGGVSRVCAFFFLFFQRIQV